jgi:hypothetical protein
MSNYLVQFIGGKMAIHGGYKKIGFKEEIKENPNAKWTLTRITPESDKLRGFYHGAIIPLWAYLNNLDHTDSNVLDFLHHEAKKEFNGEVVMIDNKPTKFGKSTKGKLNSGYIERIIEYLEENYAIDRLQVLDSEHYKDFRDRVYSSGEFDTYIDYLVFLNRLPKHE